MHQKYYSVMTMPLGSLSRPTEMDIVFVYAMQCVSSPVQHGVCLRLLENEFELIPESKGFHLLRRIRTHQDKTKHDDGRKSGLLTQKGGLKKTARRLICK